MTLADLAALGSFVSGLAVLVSLIYLALQLRQAEKNQQAAIRTGRATRMMEMNMAGTDPAVADAILKAQSGAADITATQFAQFASFCRASFYNAEDTYFQHKQGLLGDEAFRSFTASVKGWSRQPGMRAVWKSLRILYVPEFAGWMDETIAEVALDPPSDAFAQWKAEVEAMRNR
jgi:hypothetical protein